MSHITREQLEQAFQAPITIVEVGIQLGVSERTIRRLMKAYDIAPWGKSFAQGYMVKCLDGHVVASLGEAKVDDWLFTQGILHEVHKKLQGIPCIIDFWLPTYKLGIEYVGLEGIPTYEARNQEKKQIYETWRIPVVWIYPTTPLDDILLSQLKGREK